MEVVHTPESICPNCEAHLHSAAGLTAEAHGGDLSMCSVCGQLLIFNDDLTTRRMTEDEKADMSLEERVFYERARKALRL